MNERVDIAICGLGVTGLEVVRTLAESAPPGMRIVAIEARDRVEIDQPHYFWETDPEGSSLVDVEAGRYASFSVRTRVRRESRKELGRGVLDNEAYVKDRLSRTGRVQVRTGVRVDSSFQQPAYCVLKTSAGRIRASVVVDASGQSGVLAPEAEIRPPGEPVRRTVSATAATEDADPSTWLMMDLLDPGLIAGPLYVTAYPETAGTRYELVHWSPEPMEFAELETRLDGYLDAIGAGGRTPYRRDDRWTGGLRQLHRGRTIFAGAAAGLFVPWTGDALTGGLRSARIAADVAMQVAAVGHDPAAAQALLATYSRRLHDGNFGISFRFQDIGKDIVTRTYFDETVRLYERFFELPDDLLEGFLTCNLGPRDLARFVGHFWESYRFEEIPWTAAVKGAMAALSGYARIK